MIRALQIRAHELGLAAVGLAPAIDEVREAYDWAQSVVCAAISYLPPHFDTASGLLSASGDQGDTPRGLVARIARGADYHAVLREKLARLAELISEHHPGARLEICVDTCNLPERKLAVLSGIAWRGKNGNVFVEGCGSWVALGEIVTDLRLEKLAELTSSAKPAEEQTDRCGNCTRCMDACPTKAIVAPYTIDCSRCLSALTQSSGSIHTDLRGAMGSRIYGCDICQEVCPQNADIVPSAPEFAEDTFPGAHPDLIPLITLTAQRFREGIKDSSIGWIRRTRIRRNAAVAAGNLRCESALPALKDMLRDENPVLRETAEWAIKEITDSLSKS